jgi:hypothetical protein
MLIHNALQRIDVPSVVEKHHILPKSMGGTNAMSNIVSLSPKEHFVAHHLLWKIHRTSAMHYAFWLMVTKASSNGIRNYTVTSRTYQLAKVQHKIAVSKVHTGKIRSIETREKSSISLKGKPSWCKGLVGIHSAEGIEKLRLSRLGKQDSDETRLNKSKSHTGVKRGISPLKGIPAKPFDNQYFVTCPHCNKEGTVWNMKRYHFDMCKLKEKENLY